MNLNDIPQKARWNTVRDTLNQNFTKIDTEMTKVSVFSKRYFADADSATAYYGENLSVGTQALIGSSFPAPLYEWDGTEWIEKATTSSDIVVDLNGYVNDEELANAMNELKSTTVYLTQAEYDSLLADDKIDETVEYNIYEE